VQQIHDGVVGSSLQKLMVSDELNTSTTIRGNNYGPLTYQKVSISQIMFNGYTLKSIQQMLNISTEFGVDYDVKVNDTISSHEGWPSF